MKTRQSARPVSELPCLKYSARDQEREAVRKKKKKITIPKRKVRGDHVLGPIQNQGEEHVKAVLEELVSLRARGDLLKHALQDGVPIHLNEGLLVFLVFIQQLANGFHNVKLSARSERRFAEDLGK